MGYYATWDDVCGGWIPADFMVEAFDDNKDGQPDAGLFDLLAAGVNSTIEGMLGGRFKTPFAEPLISIVKDAARIITCERIYKRRGVPDETNPWSKDANAVRARLTRIATGQDPLSVAVDRAQPSAVIITEPSKTFSRGGMNI